MSFFGVTVEVIDKVLPIEGADRIEVATLRDKDFQFIIAKGSFFPGDQCLYFPVDSLIGFSYSHIARDQDGVKIPV